MDVLTDVLNAVHLSSTVFVQTRLPAPWGIRTGPRQHFAFHLIPDGECWLEVDGRPGEPVRAGDVVVIAPGNPHTLRSDQAAAVRTVEDMLADGSFCNPDPGRGTQLVCGSFRFDDMHANALTRAVPVVLHATVDQAGPWLTHTVELLAYEAFAGRPGNTTVVNRLCDALFIYLLREHLTAQASLGASWLGALEDPQIGQALELIHESPEQPWTVPLLATRVGMSRSAFAARFVELVGEAPIRYLMRWRVQKAAALLRTGDATIEGIAGRLGYESGIAFSKAFKRSFGQPPGAYRRSWRDAPPAELSTVEF
jgi:AraC-like DNA-binding protein